MRNPLTMVQEAYRSPQNGAVHGSVDDLRQRVIQTNAIFGLALVVLAIPFAVFLASRNDIQLVIHAVPLSIGSILSWRLAQTGNLRWALALQLIALTGMGVCVTLLNVGAGAVGLTIGAVAALYGYLLGDFKTTRFVFGIAILGGIGQAAILISHMVVPDIAPLAIDLSVLYVLIPLGFVAVSLTRLRQAYFTHSKTQMRAFKHLVESVQDAVARYSVEGDLTYLSHTAENFFGCKRYELAGNGFVERIHVLDRPVYLKALDEARTQGMPRSVEMRMQCVRDDHYSFIWVEASLSPVQETDPDSGGHEVIAILRDITQRKDQEVITQKAHQAAEQANQSKSRFLATIGHELRTPLNAVVGFSDMMLDNIGGELSQDHREYVSLIRQSGTHLLDTVNMLLDMSKLEAGKFELQTSAMEPSSLVEPCFAIVASAAQAKNISLESEQVNALPPMVADERACRQILINLLSNAIKFSPEGATVKLRMRTKGTRIEFSVIDQGIGISQSDIERIGEPFFQANNGLTREYEGTGLGLSIVQGLTALHSGEFKIKSTLNQGTTMMVLLPLEGAKPVDQIGNNVEELSDLQFKVEAERAAIEAEQKKAAKAG
ncbi:PAS domain-containing sensor histidine kinase [Maritalea mediterranea]|uniref:histidine kinase n=1 Tax=Maritalea mediterranea TaxID=2909667 RepID=A0ABS9E553_9HYPH|nr:PAS domain-containing sensor histidine kinase [Maritalea mediterranea]MCF4097918.1 PAS domain-containing sensor histidine kinase [Maritalea mediterranea]